MVYFRFIYRLFVFYIFFYVYEGGLGELGYFYVGLGYLDDEQFTAVLASSSVICGLFTVYLFFNVLSICACVHEGELGSLAISMWYWAISTVYWAILVTRSLCS